MKKAKRTPQKRYIRPLSHVIQARLTLVSDKHVCMQCGKDTHLMDTSYEVITQEQADLIVHEAKQHPTLEDVVTAVRHSTTAEETWKATLREQRQGLPREHLRSYRCLDCMAWMLSQATGIRGSGEAVLYKLALGPETAAVFVVRRVSDPERCILANAPFQDVGMLLSTLRKDSK